MRTTTGTRPYRNCHSDRAPDRGRNPGAGLDQNIDSAFETPQRIYNRSEFVEDSRKGSLPAALRYEDLYTLVHGGWCPCSLLFVGRECIDVVVHCTLPGFVCISTGRDVCACACTHFRSGLWFVVG